MIVLRMVGKTQGFQSWVSLMRLTQEKKSGFWHTNPIVGPFSSVNLLFSGGSMNHVFLSQIQVKLNCNLVCLVVAG